MTCQLDIASLQCITQQGEEESHEEMADRVCRAGVRWVQLRVKNLEDAAWLKIARSVQAICKQYEATFIVNDNVDIAREIDADGVHLGKNDMCPDLARIMLGPEKIIGATANTPADVKKLTQLDIDYIGLGPYRFTETKKNLEPVLGIDGVRAGVEVAGSMPIIVVGGITLDDIEVLKGAGAHGVALSSAFTGASALTKTSELTKGTYVAQSAQNC